MKMTTADTVTHRHAGTLQHWRLFWLLAAVASMIELIAWRTVDWSSSEDWEQLIGFNWRLAAPYFLLVFFASPLQRVFPGELSRWLLGNRRYLGLAFAVVCGWQLATIVLLGRRYPEALALIHANPFQYLEDVIFTMIAVMTLTSFGAVNRHISAAAWRRIHKTGIYLLGGLFTVSYVVAAIYVLDVKYVVIAVAFVAAWLLRAVVWWQRRHSWLQGWALFWAMAAAINTLAMGVWAVHDVRSDEDVGLLIRVCIRCAAVVFLIAFAAPPLQRLMPGKLTGWLLENRRYFFLAFALAFAWHLFFTLTRVVEFPKYLPMFLPWPPDIATAITWLGDVMLLTLILTSFHAFNRHIGTALLQRVRSLGTYLLAGLFTFSYFVNRSDPLHAVFLTAFVLAWLLRLLARWWPQDAARVSQRPEGSPCEEP